MSTRILDCRARVSRDCSHGQPVSHHYDGPLYELEDGTYDAPTGSVVCHACYVDLMPYTSSGQALTHELTDAIVAYRQGQEQPVPESHRFDWLFRLIRR